jgi:hypothetical protein
MNIEMDKKMILMALPVIAIIVAAMVAHSVKIKSKLSPIEKEFSAPSPTFEKVVVVSRKPVNVTALDSPIKTVFIPQKDFPQTPLSKIAPKVSEEEPKVSLIVINDSRKLAIINDKVVKEGDVINQVRVVKIENRRVLIKSKRGDKWLNLE